MSTTHPSAQRLTDSDLIAEVTRLASRERRATADLLRVLMEFDTRRLYLGEGYSSMFVYCTKVLNYSEHAALNRIEVARAARRFPALLDCVSDGSVHLTGARVLGPHLTKENSDALLGAARYKSKREIEELVAALHPRPTVPPSVRKLPVSGAPSLTTTSTQALSTPESQRPGPLAVPAPSTTNIELAVPSRDEAARRTRSVVEPLAPERYKMQFTITRETRDRLRRLQDLMRHTLPDGDPAAIFDRALTVLLEHLQRQRFATARRPREPQSPKTHSRHIPAAVMREVWHRDGGRCAFVGARGRCDETGFLEFHHVRPFAVGGEPSVENIVLRCRAHNQYEATLFFDGEVVREQAASWG